MRAMERNAFTLLEVALAIGVLSVGLTAVISLYMVSLKWAEEIRINQTALRSGQVAVFDATVLLDEDFNNAGHINTDLVARGYVNDYYIIRTIDSGKSVALPNSMGIYVPILVQVYFGGNEDDGQLVAELNCTQIIHEDYAP